LIGGHHQQEVDSKRENFQIVKLAFSFLWVLQLILDGRDRYNFVLVVQSFDTLIWGLIL
jgi:hypothetical protein